LKRITVNLAPGDISHRSAVDLLVAGRYRGRTSRYSRP